MPRRPFEQARTQRLPPNDRRGETLGKPERGIGIVRAVSLRGG
jgi:hypothetical protein